MSFISYAQNFEDVILYRALKDIKVGFYIDVGAWDPDLDSVTKAFYEMGWRGINIEPIEYYYKKLQEKRPRDINLNIAIGSKEGEAIIYEIPQTGLSTFDKETALRHQKERGYEILEKKIPIRTLTDICKDYHIAPIHFLKIDVEGAEKEVLEGIDFNLIRPWIILIESTLPNTQIENYENWEHILLKANYEYVYFDGLNRFYIAKEQNHLKKYFKAPPNVFDAFELTKNSIFTQSLNQEINLLQYDLNQKDIQIKELHSEYQNQISSYEKQLKELEQEYKNLLEAYIEKEKEILSLQEEYNRLQEAYIQKENEAIYWHNMFLEVINSDSWKITKPLRAFGRFTRWFKRGFVAWITFSPQSRPRRVLRHILIKSKNYIVARPRLKNSIKLILKPFPRVYNRLKRVGVAPQDNLELELSPRAEKNYELLTADEQCPQDNLELELSPRAKKIYELLTGDEQ